MPRGVYPRKNPARCGTRARYIGGCRCEPCTKANRDYLRELYHRTLEKSRTYFRERYHRRQGRKTVGSMDAALIRRDSEYKCIVATAEGELAALIAEQNRDDVHWIKPEPIIARTFDESRWNGWGERG